MVNKSTIIIDAKDKTSRAFDQADRNIKRLNGNVTQLAGAFAALAGASAVGGFIKSSIDAGDKIHKLSIRLGATTEELSQLEHVAGLSGVSFETMTMGLQRMTRRVAEAAAGTGEAKGALKELGLSAEGLNKLGMADKFKAIAEAISKVKNPADRVRLAMKLFDSEGVSLVQTMEDGAKGINEMMREADELGKTLSRSAAEDMAEAKDAIQRIESAAQGLGNQLAILVAGPLSDFLTSLSLIFAGGDADDRVERLAEITERMEDIRNQLNLIGDAPGFAAMAKELSAEYAKLALEFETIRATQAEVNEGATLHSITVKDALDSVTKTSEELEKQSDIGESLLESSQAEYDLHEEINELFTTRTDLFTTIGEAYEDILGSAEGLKAATEAANEQFEIMLEKVDQDLDRAFEEMPEIFGGSVEKMSMDWDRVVTGMQDAFADRIYRAFDEGISSFSDMADAMLDIFKRMVAEMVAEWAANAIFEMVVKGPSTSTGGGGIGSLVGSGLGTALGGPAGGVIGGIIGDILPFAKGGIPHGPMSGYPAMLHGREAVIPVNDDNFIRGNVMVQGDAELREEMQMMRRDIRDMRNAYLNRRRAA